MEHSTGLQPLHQAVCNKTGRALEELSIFFSERIDLFAFGVDHSDDVSMLVRHWNNDFRARRMKGGQIARVFPYVPDHDRLPRFKRRPAQPLRDRKPRVSRWLIAGAGQDDEFLFIYFVNADPAIIAGRANHLRDLLHSFRRTTSRQNKSSYLLQALTGLGLHRGKVIWLKKIRARA